MPSAAIVAATGRSEAYYTGYTGGPQEFISAAKYGFLYQGEYYMWQHGGRGTPTLDLPPSKFVNFTTGTVETTLSTDTADGVDFTVRTFADPAPPPGAPRRFGRLIFAAVP